VIPSVLATYKKAEEKFPPLHPKLNGKGTQEVSYYSENLTKFPELI